MSAGLVAMAARVSGDLGAVAQAESIRERSRRSPREDAEAYREALAAMRAPRRRHAASSGTRRSAARSCARPRFRSGSRRRPANAASLAASVAERGSEAVRGDAAAAALLAAAAARAAANLVAINLAAGSGERAGRPRAQRRRGRGDSARFVLDLVAPSSAPSSDCASPRSGDAFARPARKILTNAKPAISRRTLCCPCVYDFGDLLWSMFVFFAWIIFFWLLFIVFGDLFRRHDVSGWGKAGWTIFVILLPFLGIFIYLIANGKGMAERNVAAAQAAQTQADATSGPSPAAPRSRSRRRRSCWTAARSPRPSSTS